VREHQGPPLRPRRASTVSELRLVTATDFDEAGTFYGNVLGLPERPAVSSPHGWVVILDAGRATLELADPAHAAYVDDVRVSCTAAGRGRAKDVTAALGAQPRLCPGQHRLDRGGRLQVWTSGTNPGRSTSPRTRA
jgi:hypothetical protein